MTSFAAPVTLAAAGPAPMTWQRRLRIYLLEARYELVKVLRMPGFTIPTLTFPLMFYVIFGLAFGSGRATPAGMSLATYLIATYGAFGVIGAALFGFGVGVAIERGQGWMLLKRATPMPPFAYFVAKIALSIAFGVIIVTGLIVLGTVFGGVELSLGQMLRLAGVVVGGAIPFCALGLAIGSLAGPNSAAPTVNLIYLPMSFASGLWMPIEMLPELVQKLAPFLPAYHLGQLALRTIGGGAGRPIALHVAALLAFTVGFLLLAWFGYRRDEGKTYG